MIVFVIESEVRTVKDIVVHRPNAEDYAEALEELFNRHTAGKDARTSKANDLYNLREKMQIQMARGEPVKPAEIEKAESNYWKAVGEIREANEFEDELLGLMGDLEDGKFEEVESRLSQIFPELQPQEEKLSKRKRAILEANDGMVPSWIDRIVEETFGLGNPVSETRRLTTGRRATKVTGDIDPYSAEHVFYGATADTHGGKVRGGSKFGKGGFYVNAKGKKIRKR